MPHSDVHAIRVVDQLQKAQNRLKIIQRFTDSHQHNIRDRQSGFLLCKDHLIEQQMKEGRYPPYKASGMAYISFARRQSQLFKVLFMRDRTGEPQPAEDELTRRIIGLIMKNTGLEEQAAYTLHIELWIFIHGIASMLVTGYLNLEETVISTMVTDVYQGLLARKKEETA